MDAIIKFAHSVNRPKQELKQVEKRALLMRLEPHVYVSLSSVANALQTSRGHLSGQLLEMALEEFCDTLYQDRKDLATGVGENGEHIWNFYSPSVARDLAENSQGSFDFVGVKEEED